MSDTFVISNPPARPKDMQLDLGAKFALRLAESAPYTYIGKATTGASESASVWQIFRMDETSGLKIEWADGNSNFDNIWSDYASLSYS